MPGFAFLKGTTFEWNGTAFRIERANPDGSVLLERLMDGTLLVHSREKLLEDYSQGLVSAGARSGQDRQGPHIFSRPLEDLKPRAKAETHRRWSYVRALIEQEMFCFTEAYLRPFINTIAEEIGDVEPPAASTLYRWYARFRATRDVRSLIPRFDRRGSVELRLHPEVLRFASEAIEEAFKRSPQATVGSMRVGLAGKIEAENRRRLPGDQLKVPSRRTMYRLLDKVDTYDKIALRDGKAAANRRLRLHGRSATKTDNILERVEMDHTPLDLFLIDDKTWLPLGRPTLTVAVDHHSRMLLGYYVSYGDPSTAAVMGTLRHAILPKERRESACEGITIQNAWLCYGRPDVLVVDNALEFHGRDLEDVCLDLGISLLYCPKRQPRFKGTVERFLKTVNYSCAHQLPGTSFAKFHLRGDYDPQKQALLTLSEFITLFEKWLIDVYAQQTHRGLKVTPASMWQDGLRRREPSLPADLFDLQRRIGLVTERSLRCSGVHVNDIRYTGEDLQGILNRYGEGVRVRVVFDPEDLGAIQVWGPDQQEPVTVLAASQEFARGLTTKQNDLIRQVVRERGEATEDGDALMRAKLELTNFVQSLMVSRKQSHRRRSASIRGMSSSRPAREVAVAASYDPPVPPAVSARPVTELPLTRYRKFSVKR